MSRPARNPNYEVDDELIEWVQGYRPIHGDEVTVVEIGSGDGSLRLVEACPDVTLWTVESDPKFVGRHQHHRLHYIHAPMARCIAPGFPEVDAWYDGHVLAEALPQGVDIVIVDGPCGGRRRPGFWGHLKLFEGALAYIIDDMHRPHEYQLALRLARHFDVQMTVYPTAKKAFGVIEP